MLASIFSAAPQVVIDLTLARDNNRKRVPFHPSNLAEKGILYQDGDDVKGTATLHFQPGRPLEHLGLRIELIGRLETKTSKGTKTHDFLSMAKDLDPPGFLAESGSYDFQFKAVEMLHETYVGTNGRLRYFLKLTLTPKQGSPVTRELDIVVQNCRTPSKEKAEKLRIDVGIEDCLHIDFRLDTDTLPITGSVVGTVKFTVVRLNMRHMEVDVIRQETVGGPTVEQLTLQAMANQAAESTPLSHTNTVITQYEIMDGTPAKDETIPVRMSLRGLHVTPTYSNVQNLLSVRYFINLVLLDQDERRYFKKQEIILYRPEDQETMEEIAFASSDW